MYETHTKLERIQNSKRAKEQRKAEWKGNKSPMPYHRPKQKDWINEND